MKKAILLTLASATALLSSAGSANAGSNWSFGLFLPPAAVYVPPPPPRPVYVVRPAPVVYEYPAYGYSYQYYDEPVYYKQCKKRHKGHDKWHRHGRWDNDD